MLIGMGFHRDNNNESRQRNWGLKKLLCCLKHRKPPEREEIQRIEDLPNSNSGEVNNAGIASVDASDGNRSVRSFASVDSGYDGDDEKGLKENSSGGVTKKELKPQKRLKLTPRLPENSDSVIILPQYPSSEEKKEAEGDISESPESSSHSSHNNGSVETAGSDEDIEFKLPVRRRGNSSEIENPEELKAAHENDRIELVGGKLIKKPISEENVGNLTSQQAFDAYKNTTHPESKRNLVGYFKNPPNSSPRGSVDNNMLRQLSVATLDTNSDSFALPSVDGSNLSNLLGVSNHSEEEPSGLSFSSREGSLSPQPSEEKEQPNILNVITQQLIKETIRKKKKVAERRVHTRPPATEDEMRFI